MWKILLVSLVLVLSCCPVLYAGPALDIPLDFNQPDGTSFKARKHGDEFQNWTELESGHSVVRNKTTREWEYALQNSDGTLRGSGKKVVPNREAPKDIPPGLRPPRNYAAEKEHSKSLQNIYQQRMPGSSSTTSSQSKTVASNAPGDWSPVPVSGNRNVLLILVNFSDRTLVTTADVWHDSVFSATTGVKSVASYYKDNSFNTLSISPLAHNQAGSPAGVVTVSVPYAHPYYGTPENTWVAAAINAAGTFVNFAALDSNSNGYIDRTEAIVYLIPAGYEESGSSKTPSVWAHTATYSSGGLLAAGKRFPAFGMNGELNNSDVRHPIGVVAHEMGHQFCGLPDLYDTSSPVRNRGLGYFSLMAYGSWGRDTGDESGATPTNLDAWSREYLGWTTPVTPASALPLVLAHSLSSPDSAYKLINPLLSTSEYYLVENRQPVGWDRGLRGKTGFNSSWVGGLLVMHIDITAGTVGSNDINRYTANGGRQGVVPVQASTASCDMLADGATCSGRPTTLYYSGNNADWSPLTTPNSNYYGEIVSNFRVLGVSSPAASMTANISFVAPVVIQLPAAIDNDAWAVTTGGNGNWSGQSANTHDGVDAAQSAALLDNQSSLMLTTVNGPGTLNFWWKVSSEPNYDYLKFYLDGMEQVGVIGISGEVGWNQVTGINIPDGSHEIKWVYSKDTSGSFGSDAGWVDQVVFSGRYPLTFSFAGNGGGSVNSIIPVSPTINCISGSACNPVDFSVGTDVVLMALTDQNSIFTGWSPPSVCSGTENCAVTMDSAKNVSGTFALAPLVTVLERPGVGFNTIAEAYGDLGTADGSTIQVRINTSPFEAVTFNRNIAIALKGGFDAYFSPVNSGYSSMGTVTISAGSLTAERIMIY